MALARDLKAVARDAISDVANTYRAVLLQHTGWAVPGMYSGWGTTEEKDGPGHQADPGFGGRRSVMEVLPPQKAKEEPAPPDLSYLRYS
jgi:hypothetical protein